MNAHASQGDDEPPRVLISLDKSPGLDAGEVEELSRRLRVELLRLEVESAVPVLGTPAPAGAKAGDSASWSTFALTLAASGGALTSVVGMLRDWLLRQSTPTVIEVSIGGDSIKLEGSSTKEREQLIEAFVARHGRKQ